MGYEKRAKTGGRKVGSRNKKTVLREQQLQDAQLAAGLPVRLLDHLEGLTPLAIMQAVMRQRYAVGDYLGALAAAREAAPYVHARLTSSEVKVSHSLGDKSDAELDEEVAMIRHKVALARLTPAPVIEGEAVGVN
jgi:hypothetical protein